MIKTIMSDLTTVNTTKPIAVYLSGGIDSSIVLYHLMQHHYHIIAYTLQFDTSKDEISKARDVAAYFDCPHKIVSIDYSEFIPTMIQLQSQFPRPRFNIWPYYLAKRAQFDGCEYAFIGEGSDEMFGGYHDRGYLAGWAGQLIYVRPTFDIMNDICGLITKAPFTELHYHLSDRHGHHVPLMFYDPPNKQKLRDTYHGVLPSWIIETPGQPPGFCCYEEIGAKLNLNPMRDVRDELQRIATKAWVEVQQGD